MMNSSIINLGLNSNNWFFFEKVGSKNNLSFPLFSMNGCLRVWSTGWRQNSSNSKSKVTPVMRSISTEGAWAAVRHFLGANWISKSRISISWRSQFALAALISCVQIERIYPGSRRAFIISQSANPAARSDSIRKVLIRRRAQNSWQLCRPRGSRDRDDLTTAAYATRRAGAFAAWPTLQLTRALSPRSLVLSLSRFNWQNSRAQIRS